MGLFNIPKRKEIDIVSVVNKATALEEYKPKIKLTGTSLMDRLSAISKTVKENLSGLEGTYLIINNDDDWLEYCRNAIKDEYIAIDTETMGLSLKDQKGLVGLCIKSLNQKPAYVPVGHLSVITEDLAPNQLSRKSIKAGLDILVKGNANLIFHNGYYDRVVLYFITGYILPCYWDTLVAACMLNENESHSLKYLYDKYVAKGKNGVHKFNDLFEGIPFCYVPIKTGYIYGAFDAEQTMELFLFQKKYLTVGTDECKKYKLERVSDLFFNVELPLIEPLVDMKIRGIQVDLNKASELHDKYTKLKEDAVKLFNDSISKFKTKIDKYKIINGEIEYPPNYNSPQQLAVLFYDIIQIGTIDKKNPRGTGADILDSIIVDKRFENTPVLKLVKSISKVKEYDKLLGSFIDNIAEIAKENNGFIHCNFNSLAAKTGRMSSSSINMQQIPSHNDDIRTMFIPGDDRVFIGCDYSQQEMMAVASLANDDKMLESFNLGRDIYSHIASIAFDMPYEDCTEFNPDGTTNHDGKDRRKKSKAIALGIVYGKGVKAIADDLHVDIDKAQEIKDAILKAFPKLAAYLDDVIVFLENNGYVEDFYGRRRRLPDIFLPEYEFEFGYGSVTEDTKEYYTDLYFNKINKCKSYREKSQLIDELNSKGIKVTQNGGFIAQAIRQAYNSPVQSTASVITKKAILNIFNNKRLNELGCKIVLTIHDENVCSVPREHAYEASKLIEKCSVEAGKELAAKLRCDVCISDCWSGTEYKFNDKKELVAIE